MPWTGLSETLRSLGEAILGAAVPTVATSVENVTMRTLMLLGLIVGGLVVAGAIHITQSNGNIEISVDKAKVEAVTGQVIREGQTLIRNAQNAPAADGQPVR